MFKIEVVKTNNNDCMRLYIFYFNNCVIDFKN